MLVAVRRDPDRHDRQLIFAEANAVEHENRPVDFRQVFAAKLIDKLVPDRLPEPRDVRPAHVRRLGLNLRNVACADAGNERRDDGLVQLLGAIGGLIRCQRNFGCLAVFATLSHSRPDYFFALAFDDHATAGGSVAITVAVGGLMLCSAELAHFVSHHVADHVQHRSTQVTAKNLARVFA